jgi:hypothetical protein
VPLRLLYAVLMLATLSGAASFDPPRSKKTLDLGPSRSESHTHARITCYFFSKFMVKETDLGENGAARLAIVPITHGVVTECARAHGRTEKVINPDEWSGYFKGVKNDFVFFDADDGWNGGMGFAVYDSRTGKKIFEDAAIGPLDFSPTQGNEVSLTYTRIVDGQCIVPKDEIGCWARIQQNIRLENASMPDCKKGYEQSAQNLAKGRCQAQSTNDPQCLDREIQLARDQAKDANSIISYPVQVMLGPQPAIKPLNGEVRCWPSD